MAYLRTQLILSRSSITTIADIAPILVSADSGGNVVLWNRTRSPESLPWSKFRYEYLHEYVLPCSPLLVASMFLVFPKYIVEKSHL